MRGGWTGPRRGFGMVDAARETLPTELTLPGLIEDSFLRRVAALPMGSSRWALGCGSAIHWCDRLSTGRLRFPTGGPHIAPWPRPPIRGLTLIVAPGTGPRR